MTVRAPKLPRTHPDYQNDFEDSAAPAFKSLTIVAVSAGWVPATVVEGLLALAREKVVEAVAYIESENQMLGDPPVRAEPGEPPTSEND
jgi:hypothetical protein